MEKNIHVFIVCAVDGGKWLRSCLGRLLGNESRHPVGGRQGGPCIRSRCADEDKTCCRVGSQPASQSVRSARASNVYLNTDRAS